MKTGQFICLDCETTGLDPKEDRIIEVACVVFDIENNYETFETLVNPQCKIPDVSIAIHHITQEMVEKQLFIEKVLPQVLELVQDRIIVGHGIDFDIQILVNSCERAGIPHTLNKNRSIDTLRMARIYGESPINSLESLRKHFHIEPEIAHRAMSDVIVNIEVFRRLFKGHRSLEHLFNLLSKPILLKEMPLGKHKGRLFKDIPLEYLRWAVNKDFDQDLLFSLKNELKRRKQGNLFSQASNPFQNL